MSFYTIFENAVVVLVAIVSLYFVLRALVPGTMSRAVSSLAAWLDRPQRPRWVRALAQRFSTGAVSGCAVGCGSACNGCGTAKAQKPVTWSHADSKGHDPV